MNLLRLNKNTQEQDTFCSLTSMKLKNIHTDKDHHMAGEETSDVVIDDTS